MYSRIQTSGYHIMIQFSIRVHKYVLRPHSLTSRTFPQFSIHVTVTHWYVFWAEQSQKAITAYFLYKQLLHSGFALQYNACFSLISIFNRFGFDSTKLFYFPCSIITQKLDHFTYNVILIFKLKKMVGSGYREASELAFHFMLSRFQTKQYFYEICIYLFIRLYIHS